MIKYKTCGFSDRIDEVEIARETKSSLWIISLNGHARRASKISRYDNYHDTWKEAKDYLINSQQGKIDSCVEELNYHNQKMQKIKNLSEPK